MSELQPAIAQWESRNRDSRAVLGGIALDVAEVWLLQRGEELSERERVFVERSLELRDRLRQEEEDIISLSKRDRARMWVNGYAITGAAIVIAGLPRVPFPGSTAAALRGAGGPAFSRA